jgi:hypothetical protein
MRTMTANNVETLVKQAFATHPGEFRPCAFFDDRLDCIRVIARDCSVLEERINDRVTVMIDNHYPANGRKQYVGFVIKGARHFCHQQGLNLSKSIKITALLDAVVRSSPEIVVQWFIDVVAKPLIAEEKIEQVEVPEM